VGGKSAAGIVGAVVKAILVINQQSPEGNFGFVAEFNEEGKVIMLNITIQAFF
jgi:hypothetical protein